ncbi:MAG: bifunctional phosphopantothenoylcysteine decarboxylase/phosphopantothenate--cysteine ligase CoaBC [bacterium]
MSSSTPGLNNRRILLGISAGIAAYKTPMLVRALRAAGAEVQVVMTESAHHFVTATSLQAVSGRLVRQDLWDAGAEAAMGHIELARWADLIVIAPATANTIAKLAHGMADDLLTTLCLASSAPVWLAPAMNQQMFLHPATQANLNKVASLGYHVVGPESGDQACGEVGPGRMTEPDDIVRALATATPAATALAPAATRSLQNKTVMITAGPTQEAIDPVRYISNHSSGLQGIAMADAALAAGARVIFIAGPRVPATHPEILRVDVISAMDMQAAVHKHLAEVDIFVGVAAVADYRPLQAAGQKMKRSGQAQAGLTLELVENPDIIAGVARHPHKPRLVIGFAAETNDTHKHARQKLVRKGLDAIVVNDVSDPKIGFNSTENAATLIHADGEVTFPQQSKSQLAHGLIAQIVEIFASQLADTNPETVSE